MIHHVKVLAVKPAQNNSVHDGQTSAITNLDTMVLVLSRAMVKLNYRTVSGRGGEITLYILYFLTFILCFDVF